MSVVCLNAEWVCVRDGCVVSGLDRSLSVNHACCRLKSGSAESRSIETRFSSLLVMFCGAKCAVGEKDAKGKCSTTLWRQVIKLRLGLRFWKRPKLLSSIKAKNTLAKSLVRKDRCNWKTDKPCLISHTNKTDCSRIPVRRKQERRLHPIAFLSIVVVLSIAGDCRR